MIRFAIMVALLAAPAVVSAQIRLPVLRPAPPPPLPMLTFEQVRAQFVANSGSETVYFAGTGHALSPAARATLAAQARWLRANPAVRVRIEGHADGGDTRDHALAVGERRAEAVREFLLLEGVSAARIATTSLGKERPVVGGAGEASAAPNRRAVTTLVP